MVADRGEVPADGGGGGGGGGEGQDRHVLHQLLAHPDIDQDIRLMTLHVQLRKVVPLK